MHKKLKALIRSGTYYTMLMRVVYKRSLRGNIGSGAPLSHVFFPSRPSSLPTQVLYAICYMPSTLYRFIIQPLPPAELNSFLTSASSVALSCYQMLTAKW